MPIRHIGLASTRLVRSITPRSIAWIDWETGRGVTSIGGPVSLGAHPPLAALLDVGVRSVMLIGPRPGGTLDGFHAWRQAPDGWTDGQHYLAVTTLPILRYVGPERERVDVARFASWVGEELRPDPLDARDGWALAGDLAGREFAAGGRPATLLATPATTGREWFARCIPMGTEWPVQSSEVQELIRATTGQGRVEVLRWDGHETMPGLVEFDGRRMYTALVDRMPAGIATLHKGDHFVRFAPGRFRCTWSVPATWEHVGLLPHRSADGWRWPRRPGELAEGWIDAWELQLARDHGWPVEVHESLTWPASQPRVGPLDAWGKRLRAVADAAGAGPLAGTGRSAVAVAILRAVALHGIGSFVGRKHTVSGSVPLADADAQLPAGATGLMIEGDTLTYGLVQGAAWPEMVHPEWSAAIWARARVRLLSSPTGAKGGRAGALTVPPSHVVGFRTDAVYLTTHPGWGDDGAAGRLRHKPGPNERTAMPWPSDSVELLRAREVPYSPKPAPVEPGARQAALSGIRAARSALVRA